MRQRLPKDKLDKLAKWLDQQLKLLSGKSELAGAIRYARSRWDVLTAYVDDGRLEISNNAAENAIRPVTLGRKNWLFAGSNAGGDRAAIFYTLIRSAKLNGLEPEAWLSAPGHDDPPFRDHGDPPFRLMATHPTEVATQPVEGVSGTVG